jgi:selenocysteine lyase/cysteine desulfurase
MTLTQTRSDHEDPCALRPLLEVVGADVRVDLPDGRSVRHVNLDYAATAPALASVAARVTAVLPEYASVHRGAGLLSQRATALYEASRETIAAFAGAREDDVCVIVRNTTDAVGLLAAAVPAYAGDVLFLDSEHHANLLPWRAREHREIRHAATLAETLERVEHALAEQPTALLAVTGASNVTGEILPVAELAALAHAYGARIAVDAAQLAPHRPLDLAGWDADYVAFSGHKTYAPFGAGALVGRRDWLDAAEPHLLGGGAVEDVRSGVTVWRAAPERHEGGTPNLLGAVALAAACDALREVGPERVTGHEDALRARLALDGLERLPGVRTHRIWSDSADAVGVVAFSVEGRSPVEVSQALASGHGIALRAGRFCAHPLLTRLELPTGALRASFGVGTTTADVDRLLNALDELLV